MKGPSLGADRILKGDDTAELPRQAPVEYELTIDPKTANAFSGWRCPPALLGSADEAIEFPL